MMYYPGSSFFLNSISKFSWNIYYSKASICEQAHVTYCFEPYLEISAWEFFSPSTVNGDAPVNSSYIRTPTLHQSTACRKTIIM